jgi:hypothetical protein
VHLLLSLATTTETGGPGNHDTVEVIFAFVDESSNQLIWAVSHDGDFDEAEKAYMESPERAAAFAGVPGVSPRCSSAR